MIILSESANRYEDFYKPPDQYISGEKISRAIVKLERAGFMVDTSALSEKLGRAREDETKELRSLESDYRNIRKDGYTSGEVAAIWSSPTQLVDLIHNYIGLEPSPIYKKGQVATWKGEVRLDGVALDYLGNEHIEYRTFLHRIRNLRTIRGCIKYLSKLPNFISSDGFIHPTYGPMGDDDERTGTATGRLGMKNPEGHQIPLDIEKDPYGIRSCFIVPPGYKLVVRDYQAMEVVILAYLCDTLFGDSSLYSAVELGSAFHSKNALSVFGTRLGWTNPHNGRPIASYTMDDFKHDPYGSKLRKDAKTVWYGAQYRKTGRGFGFTLLGADGRPIGQEAGEEVLQAFLEEAPTLQKWYDFTDTWLTNHLYMPSPGGRLRFFSELLQNHRWTKKIDWKFRSAARKGGNHPIQAMGAEIKNAAIVCVQEDPRLAKIQAILEKEIHDELHDRVPAPEAEECNQYMKEDMEKAFPIPGLTTDGGIGDNWKEAK